MSSSRGQGRWAQAARSRRLRARSRAGLVRAGVVTRVWRVGERRTGRRWSSSRRSSTRPRRGRHACIEAATERTHVRVRGSSDELGDGGLRRKNGREEDVLTEQAQGGPLSGLGAAEVAGVGDGGGDRHGWRLRTGKQRVSRWLPARSRPCSRSRRRRRCPWRGLWQRGGHRRRLRRRRVHGGDQGGGSEEGGRGRWGRAKLGLGAGDAGVAYRRRGGQGWLPRMSLAPWMAATPLHRPCSEGKGISGSGLVLYSGGSASWAVWPSWPGRPFSLFFVLYFPVVSFFFVLFYF